MGKIGIETFNDITIPKDIEKISCEFDNGHEIITRHIYLGDNQTTVKICAIDLCDGIDGDSNVKVTILNKSGKTVSGIKKVGREILMDDYIYDVGCTLQARIFLVISGILSELSVK